jgi:hypothetical protein
MDLLCPDILKNEENLKTIGIETIIDTTSLYHNFYLQGVTVNDASFEEDHNRTLVFYYIFSNLK